MNTLPETGFLRLRQIIGDRQNPGIIPISRACWYQGISEGRFPAGVKISERCRAWPVAEIRELIGKLGG